MKRISWNLPFRDMDYLNSLTEELALNPHVLLITGVQTESGDIDRCNLILRESEDMDSVIFTLGASVGAHSIAYGIEKVEAEADFEAAVAMFEEAVKNMRQNAFDEEQNEEGAPKGEDFISKPEEKESEDIFDEGDRTDIDVEKIIETEETVQEKEEEEVVKEEIIEEKEKIEPTNVVTDTKFRSLLRVILKNFMK